jgi:hypothetical protein
LKEPAGIDFISGLSNALTSGNPELFSLASEAMNAFVSEAPEYLGTEKEIDKRLETLEERRARLHHEKMLHKRSTTHALWVFKLGMLAPLLNLADSENPLMRQRAGVCIAHLVNAADNDELVKTYVQDHIQITADLTPEGNVITIKDANNPDIIYTYHPIELMRRRATLEVALFTCSKSELGIWALQQSNGVQQLLILIASGQDRCQEIASEVMCLAAASEGGSVLLAPLVSTGALQSLLQSSSAGIRAAAASTMTKLTIKAKALNEESIELSDILATVLSVLKTSPLSSLNSNQNVTDGTENKNGLVSFSKLSSFNTTQNSSEKFRLHGDVNVGNITESLNNEKAGASHVSTERSIEVLAALVGRTHIKEEIVHGSYR